ncbi:basic salivary proline-rich protein 3-like [Hemicordylus capensis]|uniref:basic salivary proline-rich protein 3-like n=1 Tax=Hemicordylus capensis TaxID=884348 RepID=UPI0023023EB2|nr:basic salivary proline-rich protein 3-like [Hemicordylus capensis]XP_053115375.1 basic salivary proline-rich protein 3-like [Hemicordylus capensis]XP_053115545.1 basic salivary proline-rich protein 3-like [Hemicordylus capensis]XP_053115546.1 basic salivary proline-rich protein 3-like [Hemicordylus capensis]
MCKIKRHDIKTILPFLLGAEEEKPSGRRPITSSSLMVARKLLLSPLLRECGAASGKDTLFFDGPAPVAGPSKKRVKHPKTSKRQPPAESSSKGKPPQEGRPSALLGKAGLRRANKAPGGGVPSGEKPLPHLGEGRLPRRRLEAAGDTARRLLHIPRSNLSLHLGEAGQGVSPLGGNRFSGLSRETVLPQIPSAGKTTLTPMGRPPPKPLPSWQHPSAWQGPEPLPALMIKALGPPKADTEPCSWGHPPSVSSSVAKPPPPHFPPKPRPWEEPPSHLSQGPWLQVRALRRPADVPVATPWR